MSITPGPVCLLLVLLLQVIERVKDTILVPLLGPG